MPYVKRKEGIVVGEFPRKQEGYAEEFLDEDHPDVVAFRNPPPPTDEERIDAAFPKTDTARVIFEALFELSNRVVTLEGGNPIDRSQLRNWLKAKLPRD